MIIIKELDVSWNYIEMMFKYFNILIEVEGLLINIIFEVIWYIKFVDFYVFGDILFVVFFIVVVFIILGSDVIIYNVGINLICLGIIDIVEKMGGNI